MFATISMVASAAILLFVGASHVRGTFFGSDLSPTDPALRERMRGVSPVISNETNMWRCWIGFNAGFGMGFMLFGLIYGYLAIFHGDLLFGSPFLLVVGLLMTGGLTGLCKAYLFNIPFVITGISLVFYVVSMVVSLV